MRPCTLICSDAEKIQKSSDWVNADFNDFNDFFKKTKNRPSFSIRFFDVVFTVQHVIDDMTSPDITVIDL